MNPFKRFWKGLTTPMSRDAPPTWRYMKHYKDDNTEAYNNFTPRAQQILALARKEADHLNHNFVGTEHLLLGLIALGQGIAVKVLTNMGLVLDTVRIEVEKQVGTGPDQKTVGNIPYTPRVKKVLALAAREAKALNHTYVGTEHILLGLLREGDGVAARVLMNLNVDIEVTRNHVLGELDPNFAAKDASTLFVPKTNTPKPLRDAIDLTKRYDVYCREGDQEMVYRNVLFKGMRKLFPKEESIEFEEAVGQNMFALFQKEEFIELEETDGQAVFVARSSVIKFREHPTPESGPIPPKPE
jgi:hypothetical protein